MPEMSIVITAQDNYSNAIKKMSLVTRSFGEDQDKMELKLKQLTQNQSALQRQLKKSAEELKTLEKQCEGATDALTQGRLESERAKYDSLKRNLALVTKGARAAETQMQKTGKAFSQTSNRVERDNGMGQVFGEGGWSWTHKKTTRWNRVGANQSDKTVQRAPRPRKTNTAARSHFVCIDFISLCAADMRGKIRNKAGSIKQPPSIIRCTSTNITSTIHNIPKTTDCQGRDCYAGIVNRYQGGG